VHSGIPPLVDLTAVARQVGSAAFDRGRVYYRDGKVSELVWDDATSSLTGAVLGSSFPPYRTRIYVEVASSGFSKASDNTCTCPMAFDCKHVVATLLDSNGLHMRSLAAQPGRSTRGPAAIPVVRQAIETADAAAEVTAQQWFVPERPGVDWNPPVPEPVATWKTTLDALSDLPAASAGSTDMGLLFELREQTPRTRDRWRGPTAVTASIHKPSAQYKLAVRPVTRSATGNWVRGKVTWNSLGFLANRSGFRAEQQRWFAQLAGLFRATRGQHATYDPDWIYLDEFEGRLLWKLFDEAAAVGIPLVAGKKDGSVTIGAEAKVGVDVSAGAASDLTLAPVLLIDGVAHPVDTSGAIGDHGLYVWQAASPTRITLAPTSAALTAEQRRLLRDPAPLTIPAEESTEFLSEYYPKLRRTLEVTSSDSSVEFPTIVPPSLVLTATFLAKQTLRLEWTWDYTGSGAKKPEPLDPTAAAYRDAEFETTVSRHAEAALGAKLAASTTLKGLDAAEFSNRVLPALGDLEHLRVDIVGEQPDYRELTDTPELTVTTVDTEHRDWFDLGVVVHIEGRKIPFAPLFKALSKGAKKLLLVDNSYLSLEQPVFDDLKQLLGEADALGEWETGLRISRYQASLWAELDELADYSEQAASWQASVSGLLELASDDLAADPTPLPAGLDATMRPYQVEGYEWLAFLWRHGLGGVLADDMGLGKTLQTLALISHAVETTPAAERQPFLVVAPTSVVSNWVTEAERLAPGLVARGIASTDAKAKRPLAKEAEGADIIVTSYALFRLDFAEYAKVGWAGLILDEAQFVKNPASKAHECAVELKAPFKLAITGTPMENSLTDLWSLFNIVAPGLFANNRRFTDDYVKPITNDASEGRGAEKLAQLRRRIRPLMMRRTKELVASELPAKQEQVLRIELAPKHRKLYDAYLQKERQKLLGLIADMDKNRFIVFRSLTLLRMLSLDASLIDDKYDDVPSAKLDALAEQLEDVVAEGHRALVFSQFTSFLGKAADRLKAHGIPYEYLDGSTLKRADVIGRFKNGVAPVFLISLKAGGFGLTLTEADYVFLLDPWWNPATERQAIDRTHRIGQTRNVMVYRMVSAGTIEEKVMALKEQKAKLFDAVMDDDAVFGSALTADDIRGLLDG